MIGEKPVSDQESANIETPPKAPDAFPTVAIGMGWLTFGQLFKHIWEFIVGIILARLLLPEEFGVFAIAGVIYALVSILAYFNIPAVFIQRKYVSLRQISVIQTLSIGLGAMAWLSCIAIGPTIASFYNEPDIFQILSVLGFTLFVGSFSHIATGLLTRNFRFKEMSLIEAIVSIVYGIISIYFASAGYGVWAFVWGMTISSLIGSVSLCICAGYFPRFGWHYRYASGILRFAGSLSMASIMNQLSRNLDYLIIGKVIGPASLGLYKRAYDLATLPKDKVNDIVARIMLPILTKVRDNEVEFERTVQKTNKLVACLCFPILVGMIATANELILTLYGHNWYGSIFPLKIMAIGGIAYSLTAIWGTFLLTKKKTRDIVTIQFVSLVTLALGIVVGTFYGLEGVASGVCTAIVITAVFTATKAFRLINYTLLKLYEAVKPAFLSSIIMLLVLTIMDSRLAKIENIVLILFLKVGVGAIVYITLLVFQLRHDDDIAFISRYVNAKIRWIFSLNRR